MQRRRRISNRREFQTAIGSQVLLVDKEVRNKEAAKEI